jgi:Tfp pilus assembly protein PilN
MINLLPPEIKKNYHYARRNRQLVRWVSAFLLAILGAVIITVVGLFVMNGSIDSYKTSIADTQSQLASQDVAGTQKQVTDISNNLKLMVKVLSKEILFSKLLNRLGSITPPNVILTSLSISQTKSAIDITAQTGNYNAATQLQINLADPTNQIFSKADIVNITCATGAQVTKPNYPCTVSIRAQFTTNNPFLFINSSGASK